MKRVIIVHQWMSGVEGDWRPWLKVELIKLGYEVFVPEMPDIDNPVIEKWVSKLAEVVGIPDNDTYFVGHSIGCQAIVRYLETIKTPIGGAIFVAGWFNLINLENKQVEEIARPWIETLIDFERVKNVLPKATLIISDNDPYDCFDENKKVFEKIVNKIIIVPNAGHFSSDEGFTKLPIILDELDDLINK